MQIINNIWLFFQNQILGMKWLNELVGNLLQKIGLDLSTKLGGALNFFFYDVIKILILLSVLIYTVSYIQSYFPPSRTKRILGDFKGIRANFLSALLGTLTPFCSCSSIPLFIGFTGAGLPIGVTFSFLISSPLVDLGAFILLMSIFGAKIAIAYVVVGLVLAVIGGTIIDKLNLEDQIEPFIRNTNMPDSEIIEMTKKDRMNEAFQKTKEVVHKVWLYVLIGVGIGAMIHNVIPQQFIDNILGDNNPFSVILATIVGVPMYADIFGTIPIAEALFAKGVGIGTILSFMMAVTALSLPSMVMLRKAVRPKLLAAFIIIVTIGIIIIGYLFNTLSFLT